MAKFKRSRTFIAVLLMMNLVFSNFSASAVLAQSDEGSGSQVATGDVNIEAGAENSVNTNAVGSETNIGQAQNTDNAASANNTAENPDLTPQPSLDPLLEVTPAPVSESAPDITPTPVPAPSPTPALVSEDAPASEAMSGETPSPSPSPEAVGGTATPTPEPTIDPTPSPSSEVANIAVAPADGINADVANNNEGEIGNSIAAEGNSGSNAITNSQGDASIDTGKVNVVVGLVNAENTNITSSSLYQILLNIFENSGNDINLSGQIGGGLPANCPSGGECSSISSVANNNQGTIDNIILIDASSGNNQTSSGSGNASIRTGDVNVAANVFNLLNTNIMGSNWYNLIINIFGDWSGDLVLPGKAKMQAFTNSSGSSGVCTENCGSSVSNASVGEIENNVGIISDTGSNEASGNSSIIRTGDANSQANIMNIANTDITGGNWFFIAVNNLGTWEGQIYSLPPGFGAAGDSGDIRIYNVAMDDLAEGDSAGSGANVQNGNSNNTGASGVSNTNSGAIKNSIIINVLTGRNLASGTGSATIETGNANAFANIINVLNSNITGSNWLTGMVNIFGNWKGNLVFGRPDLWLGLSATKSSDRPRPGDTITYTLTYTNKGDADATDVAIKSDFNDQYFSVANPGGGIVNSPGEIWWNIGKVPVGGVGSVSYSVTVDPEIPFGLSSSNSHAVVVSLEKDWNIEDNTDAISTEVYRASPGWIPPSPNLQITKTRIGDGPIYAGSSIDYEIVLLNDSDGSARNASVTDNLFDKWGQTTNAAKWDLGEVFPHEKITIKYTLEIGPDVSAGSYTGIAQAEGYDYYWNLEKSRQISSVVEIKEKEKEETVAFAEDSLPSPTPSPAPSPSPEIASEVLNQTAEVSPAFEDPSLKEAIKEIKEASSEVKKVAGPIKGKVSLSESQDKTAAGSIKEILGSTVLAKEETDLSEKTDVGENNEASSGGILANIKYKNILAIFSFLVALLIVLYVLPKRARVRGI